LRLALKHIVFLDKAQHFLVW